MGCSRREEQSNTQFSPFAWHSSVLCHAALLGTLYSVTGPVKIFQTVFTLNDLKCIIYYVPLSTWSSTDSFYSDTLILKKNLILLPLLL